MYETHTTEVFVLDSMDAGEADKDLVLLTKEYGLLRARIAGVRKITSKNRFHIQEGARAHATLVKGRAFWRITALRDSVCDIKKLPARLLRARIAVLIRRLVQGESKDDRLFEHIDGVFSYIERVNPDEGVYEALEYLMAFRICAALGYVGDEPKVAHLCRTSTISDTDIQDAKKYQVDVARIVNSALYASHL